MTKKIVIAAFATVVMIVVMRWMGVELESKESPWGIVSFEFAKTFEEGKTIINTIGQRPLQWNISIDFLFLIAYTFLFFLCCKALMNQYRSSGLKTLGLIFLELSVLAGVLDLVENIAMLITLGGYGSDISVGVSYYTAIAKFSVIAVVIVYIIVASILVYLISKKKA
ncbi:MAG: hypothetical protein MUE72_04200 [Chitinophagaceae bacterium]|jgi:hypothetical protein|nr:hypothetical protein [Chitinophagaceae bacterium]